MGGLAVISAGFLAAGAALSAVPVVLHLLFRRKAPRVDLGSLRFLRVALRDNAHRRKIRRWLLLACRVAGVLLLGLLFARPYGSKPALPGPEREVAVLIDRSASMGAVGSYPRARDAASRLLDGLPEGTSVHLATFDRAGVTPEPSGTMAGVPKVAGPAGTDFAKGLAWARDRVVSSNRKLRRVHLFTDLQAVGLDRPSLDEFPPGVEVEVVDVGRKLRENLAVVDARAVSEDIRPGQPAPIAAVVLNAGPFPARGVEVRLNLEGSDGSVRLSETIDIGGSTRREVRFRPDLKAPGVYRGTVEVISNDEMPGDDVRYLAFEARSPESILLVDGEPGSTVFSNETYFLEAVLRLRGPSEGPSSTPFEPTRLAWEPGSKWPSLGGSSVVVLANVPDLPPSAAGSLRTFVEGGGRLVLFAGGKVGPRSWDSLRKVGLLPAEVEGVADGPLRFESWDKTHPILEAFADPQHGDLRSFTFTHLARLKPLDGSKVIASSRGGLPILVESKVGRGRVIQWAAPSDNEWGDWAIQRLYLPVIHQMMGDLTGRLPGSGLVEARPLESGTIPGLEAVGSKLVVRNGDPAESTIERAPLEAFRAALRLPELAGKSSEPDPEAPPPPGSTRPDEHWRAIAWALLVVLVAETFVANRTYA